MFCSCCIKILQLKYSELENKKHEPRLLYSGQVFTAEACSGAAEKEQGLLSPWFPPGEEGKTHVAA